MVQILTKLKGFVPFYGTYKQVSSKCELQQQQDIYMF